MCQCCQCVLGEVQFDLRHKRYPDAFIWKVASLDNLSNADDGANHVCDDMQLLIVDVIISD